MTLEMDADVVMAKAATVRRCIEAIRKVAKAGPALQDCPVVVHRGSIVRQTHQTKTGRGEELHRYAPA